jgi:hypothetical protein
VAGTKPAGWKACATGGVPRENVVVQRRAGLVVRLLCVALLAGGAFAVARAADDWLPVSPADLALKDNPAEPGDDAMILYRSSSVDARKATIDGVLDEEYIRIKVFTQRGAEKETSQRIIFYHEESNIKDIRARTIEPDGTVVNFDGRTFEKMIEGAGDSRFMEKTFTLEQVQPGCVIEYKYRREFPRTILPSQNWNVSGRLFARDAVFSISPYVPRSTFDPTLFFRTTGLTPGSLPQKQSDGSYRMEVHNIPGVVEEPLMPPVRMLEARVEFFYRESGTPAHETTEQYWNRVGKSWSDVLDKFDDKKGAVGQLLSQTISASDTPEQKLQKLYERVQKIPDLSYQPAKTAAEKKEESIKPNENAEDVIKHNYATGRDINWLFVGLARAAGFQADEVYIAPRNRDLFQPSGQSSAALTTNLVWVSANGKEYWLCPSAIYYPFGLLPWNVTQSAGVRVSKQGAEFVRTPAATSADSTVHRVGTIELGDDGSATGTQQYVYTGVAAASLRTTLRQADETGRTKYFEREIRRSLPASSTVSVTRISDWDDSAKPLSVESTIRIAEYGSVVGHRILVPASLYVSAFRTSFSSEKRVNDIRFNEPFEDTDEVTIHPPAGFTVEALPPAKAQKGGTSFDYEITAAQAGGAIQVTRHFAIHNISFPRDQYAALRNYFLTLKSLDEAQLVLTTPAAAKN